MKKTITTAFLTLVSVLGHAQEVQCAEQNIAMTNFPTEVKATLPVADQAPKSWFAYLRMAASDTQPVDNVKVIPGLGIGYRQMFGSSAIDASVGYSTRYIVEKDQKDTYFYTAPKVNYLYYVSASKNNSFYAGGGLAWGGIKTKENKEFLGLIPNLVVGYEMNRKSTIRGLIQLDVSQPAVALSTEKEISGPIAELSVGAGF